MTPPNGLQEILAFYGDPAPFIREDGTVSPLWAGRMVVVAFPAPLPLDWLPDKVARGARVHGVIADETARVFRVLHREGLWPNLVDFSGGYEWRRQRGSKRMSMHSFGGALDFDYSGNPLGEPGTMHPGVVQVFEAHGWTWGGRWGRRDDGHFQYASGY